MRKALCWALIVPCIVAAPVWGAVGELKLIALDPQTLAAAGIQPPSIYTRSLVAAPKGCGTVHPQAKVATLTAGSIKVAVALDSTNAGAKHPDLVRFDFTGKGRFQGSQTLPLRRGVDPRAVRLSGLMQGGEYYYFGPATLQVPRGQTTVPVSVRGQYFVGSGRRVEGSCRFGGKGYGVRVVDGNSNLRLGDGLRLTQKDGRVINPARSSGGLIGDAVLIDTTSATFKASKAQTFCGQVARVDGEWYRLGISEDGTRISATHEAGTGKVLIPGDRWSVTLIGTKNVLKLSGGKEPVDVPVDQYVAANYEASVNSDVPAKPYRLRSGYYVLIGREKGKVFDVRAGEVTKAPVGAPLTAAVTVSRSGQTVRFSGRVTDASGARVSSLYGPKGRPPEPKLAVYNDKREQVYSTTLKYG